VRAIQGRPRHESAVDAGMLPLPTIDAQVIRRSARVLERYGPDFSYGHYVAVKRLPVAAGMVGGVAGLFALAQLPPTPTWADGSALSTS
jgi:4-diphosphocytidyl-2C-methyl-D-erythritol kinase